MHSFSCSTALPRVFNLLVAVAWVIRLYTQHVCWVAENMPRSEFTPSCNITNGNHSLIARYEQCKLNLLGTLYVEGHHLKPKKLCCILKCHRSKEAASKLGSRNILLGLWACALVGVGWLYWLFLPRSKSIFLSWWACRGLRPCPETTELILVMGR